MVRVRNFIYSVNKGVLSLKNKKIRDISEIEGVEESGNIQSLILSKNKLTKIEGLEKLKGLVYLDLRNNAISNISGLEKLSNY